MVSIYSLRPIYTFLYTIINGNVIASFVQKKKHFEILWSVRTQSWNPPPPCTQSYAFGLTPALPLCAYVLCGWPLIVWIWVKISTIFYLMHICHELSIHLNNFFEIKSRRNCKIILDGKKLHGFPWWRDWGKSLHYQKTGLTPPSSPYLFCHQNFDFAIFVQCLVILAKMNPRVNGCIFWKILGLKYKKKSGFTRFALRNFYFWQALKANQCTWLFLEKCPIGWFPTDLGWKDRIPNSKDLLHWFCFINSIGCPWH